MEKFRYPDQPDILIVGGGSAGAAAAISGARMGAKVLLVEEGNCLGGVSTTAGVSEWFAHQKGVGNIFVKLRKVMKDFGAHYGRYYNPEYLKMAWQVMADQAGVDILFHTTLSDVILDGNRVIAVELVSCSQKFVVPSKVFIDCSGEGDLAALAGAEFMKGHPETGYTLHMSLSASWFDTGKPVEIKLPEDIEPIQDEEELPGLRGRVYLKDGRVYANMTKVMRHDPTNPISLSDAERTARIQLMRITEYLQRDEMKTWMLASSGATIGIREGRRIIGDMILTEEDILHSSEVVDFDDTVAVATSQIDFHSLTQKGHVGWREKVNPYAIPYRCCVVKGIDNLLMAGKCISLDQVVFSSYRMTPTVCMTGQAIGIAAGLSLETDGAVRSIDLPAFRQKLTDEGLELDPRQHRPWAPELTPDREAMY